jgi:uncharacterized protein YbjT (DUF2867 family)
VIKGDISDAEAVRRGLDGAEFVFLVTQFWETFNKAKEAAEGKAFVDAVAAAPSVKYFVASTLENVTRLSGGKITKVAHFDGKGEIEDYILLEKKLPNAVCVRLSSYFENMLGFFTPKPTAPGADTYTLTLPDMGSTPFGQVSVAETGFFVRGILDKFDEHKGKAVPLCSDLRPLADVCAVFSSVLGKSIRYNPVPESVFASFQFPGAEDLASMFAFYTDASICDRSTKASLAAFPEASSLEKWAAANKDALAAAWFGAGK